MGQLLNVKLAGDPANDAVVLLHGLFGNADNLGRLARSLCETHRVVSVDLPGHGQSPLLEDMSLTAMASAVAVTLQRQGLATAHLVGHSLGGKVAMQLASLEPDQLASLTVLDIAPVDYAHGHEAIFAAALRLDADKPQSRREADDMLSETIPEKPIRQFIMTNLQKTTDGSYGWRIDFNALKFWYPEFVAAPRLDKIYKGRTLLLKGEYSDYIQPSHEAAIRQRFTDVQFKIISGTGHWLHAEKPELVASLISRFVEQKIDNNEEQS